MANAREMIQVGDRLTVGFTSSGRTIEKRGKVHSRAKKGVWVRWEDGGRDFLRWNEIKNATRDDGPQLQVVPSIPGQSVRTFSGTSSAALKELVPAKLLRPERAPTAAPRLPRGSLVEVVEVDEAKGEITFALPDEVREACDELLEKARDAKPEELIVFDSFSAKSELVELPPKSGRKRRRLRKHKVSLVGAILRAERLKKALSQYEAADRAGVPNRRLCNIELGEDLPSDDELIKLSDALGISLDQLIEARERELHPESAAYYNSPEAPEPEPNPEPEREPEMVAAPAPAPVAEVAPTTTKVQEFTEFMEKLEELKPMPANRVERARWLRAARELFELGS